MPSKRQKDKVRAALRQSLNIEDRRNEVIVPTYDDLEHAIPGTLSDWDFPRAKRLADTMPMAQQGQPPAFSDDLVAKLMAEESASAGGYDNPRGVNLMRTLQDTAQSVPMVSPDAPLPSTAFDQGGSTGNWQPAYQALAGGTSDRWRPGLRYAPWNMR
jgi:hypothetical protein